MKARSEEEALETDGVKARSEEEALETDGVKARSEKEALETDGVKARSQDQTVETDGLKARSQDQTVETDGMKARSQDETVETDGLKARSEEEAVETYGMKGRSHDEAVETDGVKRTPLQNLSRGVLESISVENYYPHENVSIFSTIRPQVFRTADQERLQSRLTERFAILEVDCSHQFVDTSRRTSISFWLGESTENFLEIS